MARHRIPKRPAIPSESDGDTEHEESEDEEPSELTLPVGTEAEVRNADPGFHGSFYEVIVTGHLTAHDLYTVLYTTLVADDGGPLEETAAAADVRPRPPREGRREFAIHECVEALHNEGWWAGVVFAVRPPVAGAPMVYQVAFPTSRETMEFQETSLRPHRVFEAGRWVAAAEGDGCPLFQEGNQVEVSGSAKSFGASWRPASVLKVIGASNFLVKYNHIGNHTELATEIVDSQYIRPAHNWRKYKFSRYSRVEMMHEGSWWPGVIVEVIGSGMDKYKVKFKSHETSMDDVEFPRVRTVENTELRPQFRWDGKTWLRRLEEKSATGPMLASQKRPIYCGLSLQKEISETSGEHGSYRKKKLKKADIVSEPIPHLSSVCNESSGIKRKPSSSPGETGKQGNAVLAPPSLPLTAGLARLGDSSLAQSIHVEKASSQKVVTTSAPAAPQSRQLQASMFGNFGQPRPLTQSPHLGMQSLNPQTPKDVLAAKSIEEARNNVSISEDASKPKNGDDNVKLPYNVTAGCGMLTETNSVNSVEPMTIPKDIGGSQHAVSQQGHGSAMDDRLSESLAIHHLPFGNTCPIRSRIEAMEIFREMPQRPNMNQFKEYGTDFCEAMASGLMFSFASMAESIDRLDVHQDDIGGVVQGKKQGLSILEENGFDVRALRSRLEARLCTTR
ncbi:unnamed protein product [Alopecurus aequalis]